MLYDYLQVLAAFIFTITIVVFIHEFGHYIVAKLCGVKVTDFSIGFGPEIISRKDSSGTKWKICCIPLGGYVKFLGDQDAASSSANTALSDEEREFSFHNKNLIKKALIVLAGPMANFLLGIVIFAYFFATYGTFVSDTTIKDILPQSAAQRARLEPGDKIIAIDGEAITNFQDLAAYIAIHPGIKIKLTIERNGKHIIEEATPDSIEIKDKLGASSSIGKLGITFVEPKHQDLSFSQSILTSLKETYKISNLTLKGIGQIFTGKRTTKELSGPIKIARYAGVSMKEGAMSMFYFISLISINLGLVNLLPIPLLDGGHLFFYCIEWIFGKTVSDYAQKYLLKVGFIILLGLMALALFNDIVYF